MSTTRDRFLRLAGLTVVAACLFFFVRAAAQTWEALPAVAWTPGRLGVAAAALALYVLSIGAQSVSWWILLGPGAPARRVIAIELFVQLAKYVPGHLTLIAGRTELLRPLGLRRSKVLHATLVEALLLAGAGLAVAAGAALAAPRILEVLLGRLPWAGTVLAGLGALALAAGGAWLAREGRPLRLAAVAAVGAVFFPLNALVLALLARGLFAVPAPLPALLAVFSLAWVAGFVTPGSPAGLGVRDVLLLVGLEALTGPGTGLGLTVAHRAVAGLGDAAASGIGALLRLGERRRPRA